jgi:hypothetical protein
MDREEVEALVEALIEEARDGSGKQLLTSRAVLHSCLVARRAQDRLRSRQQRLGHERRRQRNLTNRLEDDIVFAWSPAGKK